MTSTAGHRYEFGPFLLDVEERRLIRDGELLRVPPKVFDLLVQLIEHAGHLLTKEQLLTAIWPETFVEEGNLAVNVNTLRRLLDDGSGRNYIETVPKRGYRFTGEVRHYNGLGDRPRPSSVGEPTEVTAAQITALPVPPPPAHPPNQRARRGLVWWALVFAGVAGVTMSVIYSTRRAPAVFPEGTQSLIVMPFQAIVPSSDQGYLELGMADALAARLGGVQHLRVPPTAAIRSQEGPFDAGRRLNVDSVLTGSVQRAGNNLRVTTQLSRVRDGAQLWGVRFDEQFTDIFAVQDAIAERIATSLLTNLSAGDRTALRRRDTNNIEAYELYLRAREQWSRRTPESVRAAIRLYERAAAVDPQYAAAHSGLADCYNLTYSGFPAAVRFPRAKAAAEKAIALNPGSAEAHTSLAFALYKFEWKWSESIREFQKAISLDPNYTLARHWYGELLGLLGLHGEAISELEKALALAPESISIRNDLGLTLLRARRPAEAWPVLEAARALDPSSGRILMTMSEVLAALGKQDESLDYRWRGLLLQGVPQHQVDGLQQAYRRGGLDALRAKQIEQLLDELARSGSSAQPGAGIATQLTWAYAEAGNRERTLYWLTKATDERDAAPLDAKVRSQFDFLRDDPAFKAILRRVGLDASQF